MKYRIQTLPQDNIGTCIVPEKSRFNEKNLERYMRDHIPEFKGDMRIRLFKSGNLSLCYQIKTPNRTYVLKRALADIFIPVAQNIRREYQVLAALYSSPFPVPKTYCFCDDETIIGAEFYLMEMCEGRTFKYLNLKGCDAPQRRRLYQAQNKALADLHLMDVKNLGLESFTKEEGYIAQQISLWRESKYCSRKHLNGDLYRLMNWLWDNAPTDEERCLVHGDYLLKNLIIEPNEEKIKVVIDWEFSTLGDPLADLGVHLASYFLPEEYSLPSLYGISKNELKKLGIPSLDEYIQMYCENTNRRKIKNLNYYLAYGFFRLAMGQHCQNLAQSVPSSRRLKTQNLLVQLAFVFVRRHEKL